VKSKIETLSGQRLKVLIADDSAAFRVSLSFLIAEATDAEVVGFAWTGSGAIELARQLKPDVMTLDLDLPEMDGLDVLEAIRKERLGTAVIVMSGLPEVRHRQRSLELGARHFFEKSTEFEKVVDILNDYGRHRSHLKKKTLVV
jgi:DNA-binding NarL/FixJ family response regulator